eukprot:766175-Hanusia_phi.AAC.3
MVKWSTSNSFTPPSLVESEVPVIEAHRHSRISPMMFTSTLPYGRPGTRFPALSGHCHQRSNPPIGLVCGCFSVLEGGVGTLRWKNIPRLSQCCFPRLPLPWWVEGKVMRTDCRWGGWGGLGVKGALSSELEKVAERGGARKRTKGGGVG